MDRRQALPNGSRLDFPGLTCIIEEEIGRGNNAIVYHGWYADGVQQDHKHHVLIKELFPYHGKGAVDRNPVDNSLFVTEEGQQTWLMHKQSFLHGNQIHLNLRERYPAETGGNINSFDWHNTLYTILDFTGGCTMDRTLADASKRLTLRRVTQRMIGILESLTLFHELGFLHLDISPDNILLLNEGKQERIELIDYNSVITLSELKVGSVIHLSQKKGFAAPETRSGVLQSFGYWTDLYSVTAVLYSFLSGTKLDPMQQMGLKAVRVTEFPIVASAPMTVQRLLQKIVTKGLSAVPRLRYQTAQEMLTDFQELLDRIDGVGITHWALWESAHAHLSKELKRNPAMRLIKDESALYPVSVKTPEGMQWNDLITLPHRAVLTGQGGQGKTTLLMRTCWQESRSYHADKPVLFYIPLYEYRAGQNNFLTDYLLRRLHFTPDVNTYEAARPVLNLLLQKPLRTKRGERPVVCLLLDGYNEIAGDTSGLRAEIERLACLDGVSLLITSRTPLPELNLETWTLNPLSPDTVNQVLTNEKLLLPESESMNTLLQNAMMLSMYVRICRDGSAQVTIADQEQLLRAYIDTLLDKEIRDLPEESAEKVQLEVAVKCIYPIIADTSLTYPTNGMELMRRIKLLYQELGKSPFVRLFPQYLGLTASIRGAANNADEWYSMMILDLLWRRLGLVYRDEQGMCHVIHQEFRDSLAGDGKVIISSLEKKRRRNITLKWSALCGALILCIGCAALGIMNTTEPLPPAYDIKLTEQALDQVQCVCFALNSQIGAVQSLLDNPTPNEHIVSADPAQSFYSFDRLLKILESNTYKIILDRNSDGSVADDVNATFDTMMAEGERMPWNAMPFDQATALKLADRLNTFGPEYAEYIRRLQVVHQYGTEEEYQQYATGLQQLLHADAKLIAAWQYIALTSRLDGLALWEQTSEGKMLSGFTQRINDIQSDNRTLQAYVSPEWADMSADQLLNECSTAIQNTRNDAELQFLTDMTYERLRRKYKLD